MTESQAISVLNMIETHGALPTMAKAKSIEALEKRIPKKATLEGDGYSDGHLVYDTWICPICEKRYEVDYDDYEYCPHCGQKIDWSDKK